MTASVFLGWIDKIVAKSVEQSTFKPCCAKGCHHCCSEALYADGREVDYIVAGFTEDQRQRVAERTKAWLVKAEPMLRMVPTIKDEVLDALVYRNQNLPCPLLEGGLCMVYERRPMGCRTFLATGDPNDCAMPMRKHQKFAEFDWGNRTWVQLWQAWFADTNRAVMDHVGVLLAERLLGEHPQSTVRREMEIEHV